MVFSSVIFILYVLPFFLPGYLLTPTRFKNIFALLVSLGFYAWGAPSFVFVLLGGIAFDFWVGRNIHRAESPWLKQRWLALALVANLGLLAYFKYVNFFIDSANAFLGLWGWQDIAWTEVALPIGISFFTFQKISYLVDVYRGTAQPMRHIWEYALYIMLFPQLIAGPIVRYHEIADQIRDRRHQLTAAFAFSGMFRLIIGLAKKLLIANPLGAQVDLAWSSGFEELGTLGAWGMILAYAFQIYFDFSAYSDMAIGLGQLMGFRLPENFNHPYTARSITEFWRRWHITLSHWMRDYLYIPLGGNRVSRPRLYANLWIVFLLSGLWHGAGWTFFLWGAYHGLWLIIERLGGNQILRRMGRIPAAAFTFLIVLLGWVLFRAESLPDAGVYLSLMFSYVPSLWVFSSYTLFLLGLGSLICFVPLYPNLAESVNRVYEPSHSYMGLISKFAVGLVLVAWSITELVSTGFNPFIYFRF